MRVSFSSSDRPKNPREKLIQPLTSQFFTQLIKLESEFNNKTYTAATLDELTQLYAQAVEYYDSIKDQISSYFIYKIQDALTTKKSLKLLMQESAKTSMLAASKDSRETKELLVEPDSQGDSSKTTGSSDTKSPSIKEENENKAKVTFAPGTTHSYLINETMGDETSEEEDDDEEEEEILRQKEKKRKAVETKRFKPRKSITSMKNIKQKIFTLQLKIQNERATEKENLVTVLKTFKGSSQDNDRVILEDISQQKNRIRDKIAQRQKESLANKTYSSNGYLGKVDMFESSTMENMLKVLDNEEDSGQSKGNTEESLFGNNNEITLDLNQEGSKGL